MFKRKIYTRVLQTLDNKQNAIVFGLRRTGKTTMLKQLNQEISNSFYLDWSDIENLVMSELDFYTKLSNLCEEFDVVLFDEVQERENWDKILFSLYNKYVADDICKIVATGSSSLLLKPKELGLDRSARIYMNTLSFEEYLEFTGKPQTLATFEYFFGRGFPMYIDYDFKIKGFKKIFDEILKPIFTEDLRNEEKRFNIGNMSILLYYLATESFGEVNESKISQKTGINRNTIRNYMEIFENANLIIRIFKVNENGKSGKNRKYKTYLNPHFYIWLNKMEFSDIVKNKPNMVGHIIEAYWIHQKSVPPYNNNEYYYMQNSVNQQEIDFVTINPATNELIDLHEIKYKSSINATDTHYLNSLKAKSKFIWVKEELIKTYPLITIESILKV